MPSRFHTAIFDFDGTIADTLPLIYAAFDAAITPSLGRSFSEREIRERFGPPDHEIIRSVLAEEYHDSAISAYVDYYEREHGRLATLFEGMDRLLCSCRQTGMKIGIVTGKSRQTAEFSLKAMGLDGDYDILVAGDDVTRYKPDPEGAHAALAAVGHPSGAPGAYVGDAASDVLAGRAAGLTTIAVTWGSPDHDELLAAKPDIVCSNVADLADALGVNFPQ